MTQPVDGNVVARDFVGRLSAAPLSSASAAVVLVDLQRLDASPDGSQAMRCKQSGRFHTVADYFLRIHSVVLPSVARLLEQTRAAGVPTIFTRCMSQTANARDNGRRFREFGIRVTPDAADSELLDELDVLPNDIVLDKTTASAFWSTNLERVLRQMNVETLIVGGVVTSGCVESLVRDATDLDFQVFLLADACADRTIDLHESALSRLHQNFAHVMRSEEIHDLLQERA